MRLYDMCHRIWFDIHKYLPKIEYRGSSLQYPIKYTPPIYEGLKPHSIRLQESILKVHLHLFALSSP